MFIMYSILLILILITIFNVIKNVPKQVQKSNWFLVYFNEGAIKLTINEKNMVHKR